MGHNNLDKIKQECDRLALIQEVYCEHDEGMVVQGGPAVSSKVHLPIILLQVSLGHLLHMLR